MSERRVTTYTVLHPPNTSREVAFAQAMAGDRALQALDLEPVQGSYAQMPEEDIGEDDDDE